MCEKFYNLRKQFPVFRFKSYKIELIDKRLKVTYHYVQSEDIQFKPSFVLYLANKDVFSNLNNLEKLNNIIFNIGMIELISYWKACASPKVIIECGSLNKEQENFFREIYFNGLGEYFYLNKINTNKNDFLTLESNSTKEHLKSEFDFKYKNLIPVGGGKDSITSIQLLEDELEDSLLFIVNPRGATLDSAKVAKMNAKTVVLQRTIDSKLLELNKLGYLNGHTPFSALLAFQATFASIIFGCKRIILSNEDSSNEGNAIFNGVEVNHQWSKSFYAEQLLNNYIKKYICCDIEYFSLLRPFYEIQIGRYFAKQKKYLEIFKSCNIGSKDNIWCGACPKCLFVYIILAPFLNSDELSKIFTKNLLDIPDLESIFFDLLKPENIKPFECVGTKQEVLVSLSLLVYKLKNNNQKLPYLLNLFEKDFAENIENYKQEAGSLFRHYNEENLIPLDLQDLLKQKMDIHLDSFEC